MRSLLLLVGTDYSRVWARLVKAAARRRAQQVGLNFNLRGCSLFQNFSLVGVGVGPMGVGDGLGIGTIGVGLGPGPGLGTKGGGGLGIGPIG